MRPRVSSVSFSRSQNDYEDDEDNIQISLAAPKIQNYLLAKASQRKKGFLGRFLPIPFERAAKNCWWDPHFDSDILEGQYKSSAFPQFRLRFRYALCYVLLVILSWFFYSIILYSLGSIPFPTIQIIVLITLSVTLTFLLIFLPNTSIFREYFSKISIFFAFFFYILSFTALLLESPGSVGHFSICMEVLLVVYTMLVMPLYLCVGSGACFSIVFEIITWYFSSDEISVSDFKVRIFCQICIHIIGVHILIMTNVRQRGTFMKVGQSLLVRKQLEMEKQLKTKMIHSVMPPKVANSLLNDDYSESLFRPFTMHRMDNVSILFADIVGFTKMSSNKTAEQLVAILNDLFERFDHLCSLNDCEKISTLGDCYYCISGCPEPNENHAKNCVEMGLGMIEAIKQFDKERNEGVNMRVGVHTGVVLCGIVGTKRFKFDVWSNDVTLANRMESTGKPGMVHISEKTCEFLGDTYVLDEGQPVFGYKTYFILGRKHERHSSFLSPNLSSSPKAIHRPRLLSYNDQKKHSKSPNFLSPGSVKIKTNSLPNILDSEGEEVEKSNPEKNSKNNNENKFKIKKLKIPKFLINNNKNKKELEDLENGATEEAIQGYQQIPEIIETIEPTKQDVNFDNKNDIIDVKSYISQSRSDVGNYDYSPTEFQFIRTESYRSNQECEKTNEGEEVRPLTRGRSATMAASIEMDNLNVPLPNLPDNHNLCDEVMSVNSRKDSGIRSNSRRSSIQQQIFAMTTTPLPPEDLSTEHRVSGYYTSSQSSINLPLPLNHSLPHHTPPPHLTALQKLRKQSDLQLIRCVQDNFKSKKSYFIKPPLNNLTLFFQEVSMEENFRKNVYKEDKGKKVVVTLASAKHNTYLDVFIMVVTFILIFGSLLQVRMTILPCVILILFLLSLLFFLVLHHKISSWYPWQAFGALLVSLPLLLTLSYPNFSIYIFFIGVIHFCNFTQLNFWMKNILVTILVSIFLSTNSTPVDLLNMILLLLLVWFINREFEISYRLTFHANFVATKDKLHIQMMKNQADWLLHNIIPKHVAEQLKKSAKYSENHKNVGVIFASIVNFTEMYDETYLGGKEYLRVLNELIADFDELLTLPRFRSVEKIKTIGSTFMAASGLDPLLRNDNEHLFSLMDFALELQKVVENFNRDLLEFDLILRVGYNFGDVVAGVIGTSKLYYDIWGDAVNIASRMDTTGVNGRIQIGENCLDVLERRYVFEARGNVYVKGKDNMNVFLLVKKRDGFDS